MKTKSRFTFIIAILAVLALCISCCLPRAFSQTATEQPHQTFFNSVTGYFTSFNTNYDSVFATHKGTLWAGQDWQGGAHASSSLGLEYLVYKQLSVDSETRFADLTGNVKAQQIGLGYNVDVHDTRLTGFLAGSYDFDTEKACPILGIRAKKLLTDHTFAFTEFVVPIEKQARPRLGFGVGFVF